MHIVAASFPVRYERMPTKNPPHDKGTGRSLLAVPPSLPDSLLSSHSIDAITGAPGSDYVHSPPRLRGEVPRCPPPGLHHPRLARASDRVLLPVNAVRYGNSESYVCQCHGTKYGINGNLPTGEGRFRVGDFPPTKDDRGVRLLAAI